jgi:hypothetical protein
VRGGADSAVNCLTESQLTRQGLICDGSRESRPIIRSAELDGVVFENRSAADIKSVSTGSGENGARQPAE